MLRYILCLLCGLLLISCSGGGGGVATIPGLLAVNVPAIVVRDEAAGFSAEVNGKASAYVWDFGPSAAPQTSTQPRPIIQFTAAGTFACSLIVSNDAGESTPITFTVTVQPVRPQPLPPVILDVSPSAIAGEEGRTVTFLAMATNIPESWEWEFGGGASQLTSTAPTPIVSLGTEGTYTGQVRATNKYGASDWITFDYQVVAPTIELLPPRITRVDIDNDLGAIGGTTVVAVEGTDLPSDWSWTFDGGVTPSTSQERQAQLSLTTSGRFQGRVTISNRAGSATQEFTYAIGGVEAVRMREHWGGVFEAEGPVMFEDGSFFTVCNSYGKFLTLDCDPGLTTLLPSSVPTMLGVPQQCHTEILSFEPDGQLARRLTWPDISMSVEGAVAGPEDSLLLLLLTTGSNGAEIHDFDPGPGVHAETLQAVRETFLLRLDRAGNLLMLLRDTEHQLGQLEMWKFAGARVFATSNSRYYYARPTGVGLVPDALITAFENNNQLWTRPLALMPALGQSTDDNALFLAGSMQESTDFGSASASDLRAVIGQTDIWLSALEATGDRAWTRTWGGRSSPQGGARSGPQGLLLIDQDRLLMAGSWSNDLMDFDAGPGELIRFLPVPCPDERSSHNAFLLHLDREGMTEQVHLWPSDYTTAYGHRLQPLGDGIALSLPLAPCEISGSDRDLDPGPAEHLAQPDSTFALLSLDMDGTFRGSLEWNFSQVQEILYRFDLGPAPSGGLLLSQRPALEDIDPGPGILDVRALISSPPSSYTSVIYLDPQLRWSSPAAP